MRRVEPRHRGPFRPRRGGFLAHGGVGGHRLGAYEYSPVPQTHRLARGGAAVERREDSRPSGRGGRVRHHGVVRGEAGRGGQETQSDGDGNARVRFRRDKVHQRVSRLQIRIIIYTGT